MSLFGLFVQGSQDRESFDPNNPLHLIYRRGQREALVVLSEAIRRVEKAAGQPMSSHEILGLLTYSVGLLTGHESDIAGSAVEDENVRDRLRDLFQAEIDRRTGNGEPQDPAS